jgi:Tfp pilus assembly protein PilZ
MQGDGGGFERIPLIARCWTRARQGEREAMIVSLSVLGVYVIAETLPGEGERIELRFPLPDGARPVDCEAEVTWKNAAPQLSLDSLPRGYGVRFVSMEPWDRQRIETLVADYRHSMQPALDHPRAAASRIPYIQPCLLTTPTGATQAVVCNLSTLGLYVAVDPIPPFDTRVLVTFPLPRAPEPLDVECEVAWINPDEPAEVDSLPTGCGLRFCLLDDAQRLCIERLVEEYRALSKGDAGA